MSKLRTGLLMAGAVVALIALYQGIDLRAESAPQEEPKPVAKDTPRPAENGPDVPAEPTLLLGNKKFQLGGQINHLQYSSNGKQLLTAGLGWGAAVWDSETGELIRHFPLNGSFSAADFSPDGKRVALAGHHEAPVTVRDIESGEQVCAIGKGANAVWFSPDGKTLFTATRQTLTGYDVATGEQQPQVAEVGKGRWSIAADPKGTLVAGITSHPVELWVWDWRTRQVVASTTDVGSGIHGRKDLALTPDGKALVVLGKSKNSWDQHGELRDARTLKVIRRFDVRGARALAVSPDGKLVAFGTFQGRAEVFELESGKQVKDWQAHASPEHISALAFSPDGKHLACGTDQTSEVRVWDLATWKEVFPSTGHRATIDELAVLKDGTIIGQDRNWRFGHWDPATGKASEFWEWPWPGWLGCKWAYSSEANRTLIGNESLYLGADPSDSKDTYVDVFPKAVPPYKQRRILAVAMSADGKYGATATYLDHCVSVCDLTTLTHVRTFTLPQVGLFASSGAYSLALSPDGGVLATCSLKTKVQLWDVKTGKELSSPELGFSVQHLTFSPDGKTLALVGSQQVMIWDAKRGRVSKTISIPEDEVRSIAFSPDSAILAIGSVEHRDVVRLWDLATGREIQRFGGARGGATSLAFSPDGRRLYAGTGSSLIVGWDLGRD